MTAAKLIALLSRYPALSEVKVYDAETDGLLPVVGVIYGSEVLEISTEPDDEEEEDDTDDLDDDDTEDPPK
jgi:hypothetical protein